jgi:lambda family phage portal protein
MGLKHYEESERVAARVAASFAAVITRQPVFGQATKYTAGNDRAFELEAGMVMDELAPGEKLEVVDTKRPNSGLEAFRNAMLKAVATGLGTSYSTISKDYSGTYSSQRQEMQETSIGFRRLREYWVAAFLEPIYSEFVRMAVLMGEIPAAGFSMQQLTHATYAGAQIPWIDPLKEAQANELAVKNGFKSRQQVLREMGMDRRQVDDETNADPFELPAPPVPPGGNDDNQEEGEDANPES